MSNSSLVNCTILSPNHSGKRTSSIDRITPHCVVGQLSAEGIGNCFPSGRNASCNYGIGTEGRVCLIVEEGNRSWCTSSNANDQRAVTIECASDKSEPYAMNNKVYNKLVDLCVDICKRNGKTKLLWFADKDKSLNYKPASNEMIITVHRWFANKSCPGEWLYSRLGELANTVTKKLNEVETAGEVLYRVQVGAYSKKENAEAMAKKLKAAGFDAIIKVEEKNAGTGVQAAASTVVKKSNAEIAKEIYKGICSDSRWTTWGSGEARVKRLTEAGYDPDAVQKEVNKLF